LLFGVAGLMLVGFGFINHARMGWISTLFGILVLTIIFISFGSLASVQRQFPTEIALGLNPSWSVTKDTIFSGIKNFILGSGLGTFSVDFSRFRPENFNYNDVAWSLRFGYPFNSFFAFFAEGGVLLGLSFSFLFVFVLGYILHSWLKSRPDSALKNVGDTLMIKKINLKIDIFVVSVAWIVLTLALSTYFFTSVVWWVWWLLLSLVLTGLSFINSNIITDKEWNVDDSPQHSLSFSFVMIVVMIAVIMSGVCGAKMYMAERAYSLAYHSSNLEEAEANLLKAINNRSGVDSYYIGLAQVYLNKAIEISQKENPDAQAISLLLAEAVNQAKIATELSPSSVSLWENLAVMYENAATVIPDAREWAIKSWGTASELEPTSPVFFLKLGANYALQENYEKAIENYEKAIELKTNYSAAYLGLSGVYEIQQNEEKAIETYEKILGIGINDIDVLFNYGRLLYNRDNGDDRTNARDIWLAIVEKQPNYSNALYSLGLYYESKNNFSEALKYYYKVRDLNEDNEQIKEKINSLTRTEALSTEE